jgi:hypothetical protein
MEFVGSAPNAAGVRSADVSSAKETVNLRRRFARSMLDCRAAAEAYPGDYSALLGSLYRRSVGRLSESATELVGDPWRDEFLALAPAERARALRVARQTTAD